MEKKFTDILKESSMDIWEKGFNHPFVQELGQGTLDKEKFKFYLLQDYQYLIQYAKVYAQALIKCDDVKIMTKLANVQNIILDGEMIVHKQYMKQFGVSEEEMLKVKTSLYNRTYTANMLAISNCYGLPEIVATIFPCAWTYKDYGVRLREKYIDKLENNFYKSWIDVYSGKEFADSFEWFYDYMNTVAERMNEEEKERLIEIFRNSVEFEYLFWDMAYKMEMGYEL